MLDNLDQADFDLNTLAFKKYFPNGREGVKTVLFDIPNRDLPLFKKLIEKYGADITHENNLVLLPHLAKTKKKAMLNYLMTDPQQKEKVKSIFKKHPDIATEFIFNTIKNAANLKETQNTIQSFIELGGRLDVKDDSGQTIFNIISSKKIALNEGKEFLNYLNGLPQLKNATEIKTTVSIIAC